MMRSLSGTIVKGVGGLYTVETQEGRFACKARGVFRKEGVRPLPGDRVRIEVDDLSAVISQIEDRVNQLNRPPVANIDKLVIISGAAVPSPNTLIIDRLTAAGEKHGVEPIVVFSKSDLADMSELVRIYRAAGFRSFAFSSVTGEGLEGFDEVFDGGLCVLTGNSGVGKSTLLNKIAPDLALETGDVSKKLGRGRHTTRAVELFRVGGAYVADTPGFSSLDMEGGEFINKYELADCFRDLSAYRDGCRFTGCSHTTEKGCAVLRALAEGKIEPTRHESYLAMYREAKAVPDWKMKQLS